VTSGATETRDVSRLALRPKEAAVALGISERTLRGLLPQLPHVRVGGVVLLPVDALKDWLRERAAEGSSRVDRAVVEMLDDL
jgi:excisionase family DNA binding protein